MLLCNIFINIYIHTHIVAASTAAAAAAAAAAAQFTVGTGRASQTVGANWGGFEGSGLGFGIRGLRFKVWG